MATSTSTPATAEPVPELPAPEDLTERQLRGADCVLCATCLNNATAVDLGARTVDAHGTVTSWFPRACAGCAS
ncbi:hypothetical protein [Streptomyces sp. NPDC058155]|uniref:hypothetical protein n=1 Tax=Streptomyces sp. NPDC058155 TaxID=3346359 RepID=UPI0036E816C4